MAHESGKVNDSPVPNIILADEVKNTVRWCQFALDLLAKALCEWGIGGKTSSGYGRFTTPAAQADQNAPPSAAPALIKQPRHKPGELVTVTRVEDPKGKGRPWFQADDGFSGAVAGGTPPSLPIGQTTQLEIGAILQGQGYNFRVPRPMVPASAPHKPKLT
jgi:hypothetical protein